MKHEHLADDRDRAELQAADSLVKDGKAIRKRVMTRLRARAYRERKEK